MRQREEEEGPGTEEEGQWEWELQLGIGQYVPVSSAKKWGTGKFLCLAMESGVSRGHTEVRRSKPYVSGFSNSTRDGRPVAFCSFQFVYVSGACDFLKCHSSEMELVCVGVHDMRQSCGVSEMCSRLFHVWVAMDDLSLCICGYRLWLVGGATMYMCTCM